VDDYESVEIRFLDSARFMQSSLDKLTQNLSRENFNSVRSKCQTEEQFELITRKGVLPYEYFDSWDKLIETELPSQEKFNNKLTDSNCSDEDYEHAKRVWRTFNCQNLWQYMKIYLITDVLLLADVFENFRNVCFRIYNL